MEMEAEYNMFGGLTDLHHEIANTDQPACYGICENSYIDYCHE